jgi:hypothetical protein
MGWTDEVTREVKRLRADGHSWTQTAQTIKKAYPHELRNFTETQALRKARNVARTTKAPINRPLETRRYFKDGTIESSTLIEVMTGDDLNPENILTAHKLDPDKWELTSYTNNVWQGLTGGDQSKDLYQSKISARPKQDGLTFADVDAYFERKRSEKVKPIIAPKQYEADGEVLEICLPDLHVGLLSWAAETGADYDVHIAKAGFMQCVYDIAERCEGKKFSRIYLVTLGDLLHIDNDNQTTTKGTLQQADGRMAKIFSFALDMMIAGIDLLMTIAPVEVVYLSGNHDRVLGYTLIKALEMAYRHDSGIAFDVEPNPQKHRLIGVSLIGWTHGDMSRKNIGDWLIDRAREDYGKSLYAEVHSGHLHHEYVRQDGAIIVRSLPTISNASWWEHQQGYPKGMKTMMCFVWCMSRGLRGMWYSNL